jgi:hypothetical protein
MKTGRHVIFGGGGFHGSKNLWVPATPSHNCIDIASAKHWRSNQRVATSISSRSSFCLVPLCIAKCDDAKSIVSFFEIVTDLELMEARKCQWMSPVHTSKKTYLAKDVDPFLSSFNAGGYRSFSRPAKPRTETRMDEVRCC